MGEIFSFFFAMSYWGNEASLGDKEIHDLIARIRAGDVAAEDKLLRLVLPRIARFAQVRRRGAYDWQDIVQDCGEQILASMKRENFSFDPQQGKIQSYLWGIAGKVMAQNFKTRKRYDGRRHNQDIAELDQSATLDLAARERIGLIANAIDVVMKEGQERLWRCIKALPEKQREVVISQYYEKEKHKTIAERLGLRKAQQVADLKRLAMERLRKCMEEYYSS